MSLAQISALPDEFEANWYGSTKEQLSPVDVFQGLLDYGLFAEKIPPCFTSRGLAEFVKTTMGTLLDPTKDKILKDAISGRAHDYLRYEALRDINIPRHMGIPHPESYAVQALAISKHWREIATHCNLPVPAFSRIYVRHTGDGRIFEMNYQGNEKYQLEEEELEWASGAQHVVVADIAGCFPSIYTHIVPWALHTKPVAKTARGPGSLVGNLLDSCTQVTKDGQTNGLLIGPHASNIISEIILTAVDFELQTKGHRKIKRYIDDYHFYATTIEEAEGFIRNLGMSLRKYELSLNEKKTRILPLPRPSDENWVVALNRFQFPVGGDIKFSVIRSYLDLALECAQTAGKSTPLNYAIKVLSGIQIDAKPDDSSAPKVRCLNERAKRMYTQEAMNLTLSFPYLAPLLEKFIFDRFWHAELQSKIAVFATELTKLGIKKLYTDTIAHALYFALKYDFSLDLADEDWLKIIALDDCITNVILLEYVKIRGLKQVADRIIERAKELLSAERREQDQQWLLIYQVWTKDELKDCNQSFLAILKEKGFEFFCLPWLFEHQKLSTVGQLVADNGEERNS